jgi:hypothetical protein
VQAGSDEKMFSKSSDNEDIDDDKGDSEHVSDSDSYQSQPPQFNVGDVVEVRNLTKAK